MNRLVMQSLPSKGQSFVTASLPATQSTTSTSETIPKSISQARPLATITSSITQNIASTSVATLISSSTATSITTQSTPTYDGCSYQVPGAGTFAHSFKADFTKLVTLPGNLVISTNTLDPGYGSFSRQFSAGLVSIVPGSYLGLTMPGGQIVNPLQCSQITTRYNDILYASVRTVAKVSSVPGSIQAAFSYYNDTQESDVEFRNSGGAMSLFVTNQNITGGAPVAIDVSGSASTGFHEYRQDVSVSLDHGFSCSTGGNAVEALYVLTFFVLCSLKSCSFAEEKRSNISIH